MKALHEAPGGGPAPTDAGATASTWGAWDLRSRLEQLQDLDGAALREEWRRLCRTEPPRISRDLLLRAIAYRLQELEFGGLPKWARESLAGSATGCDAADASGQPTPKPPELRLKFGARLVREWHGRTHAVAVLDDAFEFEGRRYRSLTQIAREITGAHWSGPRFFGLTKRRAGPWSDAAPTPAAAAGEMSGHAPLKPGEPSTEAWPEMEGADGSDARHLQAPAKVAAYG